MRYMIIARRQKMIDCHPTTPCVGNVRILIRAAQVIRTKARRLNLNNPFVGFSAIGKHFNMCNSVAFYKYCLPTGDFEPSKNMALLPI
jgi:hypothetical protein